MVYQSLSLVQAPAVLPITLAQAKAHLRVDGSDEDNLIEALIGAATDHVSGRNGYTGRALVPQIWDCYLQQLPLRPIYLPLSPLIAIDSIVYKDASGEEQTLDADLYSVNATSAPAYIELLSGKNWPDLFGSWDSVKIRFECGYSPTDTDSPTDLASGVPEAIKAAIKLVIGDLYAHREGQALQSGVKYEVNPTVKALLSPYRIDFGL